MVLHEVINSASESILASGSEGASPSTDSASFDSG
jgi:hypothetical protein